MSATEISVCEFIPRHKIRTPRRERRCALYRATANSSDSENGEQPKRWRKKKATGQSRLPSRKLTDRGTDTPADTESADDLEYHPSSESSTESADDLEYQPSSESSSFGSFWSVYLSGVSNDHDFKLGTCDQRSHLVSRARRGWLAARLRSHLEAGREVCMSNSTPSSETDFELGTCDQQSHLEADHSDREACMSNSTPSSDTDQVIVVVEQSLITNMKRDDPVLKQNFGKASDTFKSITALSCKSIIDQRNINSMQSNIKYHDCKPSARLRSSVPATNPGVRPQRRLLSSILIMIKSFHRIMKLEAMVSSRLVRLLNKVLDLPPRGDEGKYEHSASTPTTEKSRSMHTAENISQMYIDKWTSNKLNQSSPEPEYFYHKTTEVNYDPNLNYGSNQLLYALLLLVESGMINSSNEEVQPVHYPPVDKDTLPQSSPLSSDTSQYSSSISPSSNVHREYEHSETSSQSGCYSTASAGYAAESDYHSRSDISIQRCYKKKLGVHPCHLAQKKLNCQWVHGDKLSQYNSSSEGDSSSIVSARALPKKRKAKKIQGDEYVGYDSEKEAERHVQTVRQTRFSGLPPSHLEEFHAPYKWQYIDIYSDDDSESDDLPTGNGTAPNLFAAQSKTQQRQLEAITDTSSEESHFSINIKYGDT